MHPELNSCIKRLSIAISAILLSSCASTPPQSYADIESRDIVVAEPIVEQVQVNEDNHRDRRAAVVQEPTLTVEDINSSRADFYEQQALTESNRSAQIDSALSAAEYYIQAQNYREAQRASTGLRTEPLSSIQSDRLNVIDAYVAYSQADYSGSLAILRPMWELEPEPEVLNEIKIKKDLDLEFDNLDEIELPTIPEFPSLSSQQIDALLLGSFSYQALGDYNSALHALIRRERALNGKSRNETTRYIWQVISSLSVERRQVIFDSTEYPLVKNRIEQSLLLQSTPIAEQPQQFNRWREEKSTTSKQALNELWSATSPQEIAVLLPLSSRFNKAAQAVKDGINYQHESNTSTYRPRLRFYDIGDQAHMASQYYANAVRAGADFVIGPLGKDYANQISQYNDSAYASQAYETPAVPNLLLGGDIPLNSSTSRFSLSPEMEGARVAERAWRDGHLSAALLVTNTSSSTRTVSAFTRKWLQLGGKITEVIRYSPEQYDHSVELRQLFNINQSHNRHQSISDVLGYKPKFSAYQRSDIDFIFMIANTETGRLIRPQVNFFSGSRVPVYATSMIFNGIQDEVNNFDLDGTQFPVMPWVLKSTEVAPYAGQLNRLFALGSDAYSVAASYQKLRRDKQLAINGNTGQVSIDAYGETVYQPIWATFEQGKVTPLETLGLDITPLTPANSELIDHQNVNGTYNDSTYNEKTWDPQNQTRRSSRQNLLENRRKEFRGSR